MFSRRRDMTQNLLVSFADRVVWSQISLNRHVFPLDDALMESVEHKLHWPSVTKVMAKKLVRSPQQFFEFIRKWQNRVDWNVVSEFRGGVEVEFLREFAHMINWAKVLPHVSSPITYSFVVEFSNWLVWPVVLSCFNRFQSAFQALQIADHFFQHLDMSRFCLLYNYYFMADTMPEDFLDKHFRYICPSVISRFPHLSGRFLLKYAGYLDWQLVSRFHKGINDAFLLEFGPALENKLVWSEIPKRHKLTLTRYYDYLPNYFFSSSNL